MFINHKASHQLADTFTTGCLLDASPHHLGGILKNPDLFRPPLVERLPHCPIAIHLDPGSRGCSALTLHCPTAGISERQPLQIKQLSPWTMLAETTDPNDHGASQVPTFALWFGLIPLVQPGGIITTRVSLTFHFVREAWWPTDIATALADIADLWLRRLTNQTPPAASHRRSPTH
ncbi:hypothetical protein BHAOGJBA_0400 [Methylobacterium hispanicum]|jgi:hypothetical protein|uniref:Uncharacterized protein n=1 Tax=Methylobacterium hispanicum TaxID=270350 RepID=A0AAV4ZEW3_9HYPH|nr:MULTISPECIES: hypothetical protein [Methylobacterium]GJD86902.1 hypothetical protein BHAOGJBA_0400 [Methylobacterium hispanicum]